MREEVRKMLYRVYDKSLVDKLLAIYQDLLQDYSTSAWKGFGISVGFFVEVVRRILFQELEGAVLSLSKKLGNFDNQELLRLENLKGDSSYILVIPRVLHAMYTIRNKRGGGHVTNIDVNKMDSRLNLYQAKRILAELVRLNSNLSIDETQSLVDSINSDVLSIVREVTEKNILRVLDNSYTEKEKAIILIAHKGSILHNELLAAIEPNNASRFKSYLKELHRQSLIHITSENEYLITPSGTNYFKGLIEKRENTS